MKATLEFDLREERSSYSNAVHADYIAMMLWDLDNTCRGWMKHGGHNFETPEDVMEWVRDFIQVEVNRQICTQPLWSEKNSEKFSRKSTNR